MQFNRLAISSAVAAACLFATQAQAVTVTLSNILGQWINPIPVGNIDSNTAAPAAVAQIRWGLAGSADSGYNFNSIGTQAFNLPPDPSAILSLGTFQHVNFPVSQSITGVDLSITADVDVGGTGAGNRDFVFHFTHDETPNDVDPNCPYGVGTGINANGCADRVSVSFLGASDTFDIGGVAYTINILGFLPATGGPMVSDFLTMESAVNTADLMAQVVRRSDINVPEPATLALVGISLLGLAATRRRSA